MDWNAIIISGLSGALAFFVAGVIAKLFLKDTDMSKNIMAIIGVVLFFLFQNISKTYIVPLFSNSSLESRMYKLDHFYSMVKEKAPKLYKEMIIAIENAKKQGLSENDAILQVSANVQNMAMKNLKFADDKLVLSFTKHMLETLKQLKKLDQNNANYCFSYLFPKTKKNSEYYIYLGEEWKKKTLDIIIDLMKVTNKRPLLTKEDKPKIKKDFVAIYQNIFDKYGKIDPFSPNVDKQKVCNSAIDLYSSILKLPEDRASKLLRIIFSPK